MHKEHVMFDSKILVREKEKNNAKCIPKTKQLYILLFIFSKPTVIFELRIMSTSVKCKHT